MCAPPAAIMVGNHSFNDLLHLSDGASCCRSIDQLGLSTTYRFTFTQATFDPFLPSAQKASEPR
jgi:hypothetical protein